MTNDNHWKRHFDRLFGCRDCPTVEGRPVTGPATDVSILLVGQAPGPREEEAGKPFAWTAGQRMFEWFSGLGVDEQTFREGVYMCAVIRCFPGRNESGRGDRLPSADEIEECAKYLDHEIELLEPSLVILVGTLAAKQFLDQSTLAKIVGRLHRSERAGRRFDVVVLPHPSGRSTWLNREENRKLLEKSLELIRGHEAWRKTFGSG